jgi:hypothetical protein
MRRATEIGSIEIQSPLEIIVPFHPGNDRRLGVLDENTRLFLKPGTYAVFDSEVGGTYAIVEATDEEGAACSYRVGFGLNATANAFISSLLSSSARKANAFGSSLLDSGPRVILKSGFKIASFALSSGRVAYRVEYQGEPLH